MITQYALRNKHLTPLLLMILCTCCALTASVHAQPVHLPDSNLRQAVSEALNLPTGAPITEADMRQLTTLNAAAREIIELTGLEYATNLTELRLGENPIRDISPLMHLTQLSILRLNDCWTIDDINPLAHLTQLRVLDLDRNLIFDISPLAGLTALESLDIRYNQIENLSPLANLTQLTTLWLTSNQIEDVSPLGALTQLTTLWLNNNKIENVRALANLTQLTTLWLNNNKIENVRALATLTRLEVLHILRNNIIDHSPLDGLSLTDFLYDQTCEMPPPPLAPRIKNRTYPSVFSRWGARNPPLYDLWFDVLPHELNFRDTSHGVEIVGLVDRVMQWRGEYLAINPNMVFLVSLHFRSAGPRDYPDDWPYWLRDAQGNIVEGFIDFTHPGFQDRMVAQAIAVSECGFDGIMIDWWNDEGPLLITVNPYVEYRGYDVEMRAKLNILKRIRASTRPDFLIMGNTNRFIIPTTGPYINGGFMETGIPENRTPGDLELAINQAENSLIWLEHNLREPRINALEGFSLPDEPLDSPNNIRWVRTLTTLSLTHSDGYVLYTESFFSENPTGNIWYDFWDADLGQPVGEKQQLYQGTEGLYIREFTNGWAVYNHSGAEQTIMLPELASGVASGVESMEHTLPNLDGEMYLRMKPPNPADVNGDGVVNILDLVVVAQAFGKDGLQGDVNGDGVVNVFDLVFVAGAIGGGGAAPSAYSPDLSIISTADVERWLAQVQGLGVGDANFQRGIRFLEGLLAALTPKETTLLPNYPNPFNPETWIPYRLAREAEVAITIYDTKGTRVRRLALGNQAAGYYAARGKAAYWDGRNEDGEAVASGIYIYQFRAGDYAATRRMVIVK